MSKIRKTVAAACLAAVWASGATMAPAATPMLAADQVSITSPTSGVTNQTKMDVTVTFSTGTTVKGGGNITTVQLLMNGNVVASYDNPPQTKSGTHTFLSVDFSSAANTGSAATLVARAYHANVKAGQYAYSSAVILIVDTIAPTITNLLPAWGSTLNISQPTLSAMVNDTGGSGLDPASIVLRLDGNIAAATVTLISSNLASVSFVPSFSLLSGSHTFTVDAKDRAGNAALTASATFQLDLAPLIVTISSPATGLVGRNNVIPLAATLSDAGGPGINTQSVVTKLDGGTISATLTSSSPTSASLAYTPPAALPDGTHTYTIDAKDQAGIPAKTATSVFTIDQTPPVLTLSPADGQRVLGPTPTISISYSDAISGVDLRSLRVTLDGTDITWAMTSGPAQATLTAPSPLLDGPHTLQVQLADQAGNVAQVSSNFRSDSAISPVGAAGGAVGITNPSVPGFGAEILIPPGALSENVTFFIEAISSFPPLPQGFGSAGPVVDFGPTTVFALPVTISVPYDPLTLVPLNLSPLGLRLFLFDSSSHTWTLVPILSVDAQNHVVTAQVTQIVGVTATTAYPIISPSLSLISIPSGGTVADGVSLATLTVTPMNLQGALAGPNQEVEVTVSGIGNPAVLVQDLGNGLYQVFISSQVPGTASVVINVDETDLPTQTVQFTPQPAGFSIDGLAGSLVAGATTSVTISARDASGAILTFFTGVVEIDLSGTRDASGNLVFPDTIWAVFTAADQGVLTIPLVFAMASTPTQSQTITVLNLNNTSVTGIASVQVTAGPPFNFTKLDGDQQSGAAGSTLQRPLRVRLTDQFGNPVQGAQVQFSVQSGSAGFAQ